MSGHKPSKSFLLTAALAAIAAAAPIVNDAAQQCCGITITEAELQHLLYTFIGSAGIGGAVGIHKRHAAGKSAGNGGGAGPGNGSNATLTAVLSTLLHAEAPKGGHGKDIADDIADALHDLEDDDDDPDETPPPRGG